MTAADKPRADLVALLLQFEACAAGMSSLYLTTADAEPAVAAWVEMRGHRVQVESLTRTRDGKLIAWTHWTVTSATGRDWTVTCSLHDDHEVTAPAAQADPEVLARVRAALDGERPAANSCSRCGDLMMTTSSGEYCISGCRDEQPAAEGSV